MSLYNQLFGFNSTAPSVIFMLGVRGTDIPRWRDAYFVSRDEMVLYTRTGGGNRAYYDSEESCRQHYPEYWQGPPAEHPTGPWNADLRKLPGYLRDYNDDFDSTYAYFVFAVPDDKKWFAEAVLKRDGVQLPRAQWDKLFEDLRAGNTANPAVAKALKLPERLGTLMKDRTLELHRSRQSGEGVL